MRRSHTLEVAVGLMALLVHGVGHACWDDAGARYGVAPQLLYAVARAESDLNPAAVNLTHRARTKSYDIGLMQINSSHLPTLARFGISERDLYEPCTNIMVGAWLLADQFARQGVSWDSVGAYNAACTQLKGAACRARAVRRMPGACTDAFRVKPPAIARRNRPHREPGSCRSRRAVQHRSFCLQGSHHEPAPHQGHGGVRLRRHACGRHGLVLVRALVRTTRQDRQPPAAARPAPLRIVQLNFGQNAYSAPLCASPPVPRSHPRRSPVRGTARCSHCPMP